MKKLGFTLLALALSAPFTFAKTPAQASSTSQPQTKTAKHKVKRHKKHSTKSMQSKNAEPTVK
jgi:hypothetical protein